MKGVTSVTPYCPNCKQIRTSLSGYEEQVSVGGKKVAVVVVYCIMCGHILGVVST